MRQKRHTLFLHPSVSVDAEILLRGQKRREKNRGIYYSGRIDREMLTVIHFGTVGRGEGGGVFKPVRKLNKKYFMLRWWTIYSSFRFGWKLIQRRRKRRKFDSTRFFLKRGEEKIPWSFFFFYLELSLRYTINYNSMNYYLIEYYALKKM